LGTRPEPAAMRHLLDLARVDAGVTPVLPDLPEGVQAVERHGADRSYLILLNHGTGPVSVALPAPSVDLLSDRSRSLDRVLLASRAVAVLRYA
jgi:beta-galactosidase